MNAVNLFGQHWSEQCRAGHFTCLGLASAVAEVPVDYQSRVGPDVQPRELVEGFNERAVSLLGGLVGVFRLGISPYLKGGQVDREDLGRMVEFLRHRYWNKPILLDCFSAMRRWQKDDGISPMVALETAREFQTEAVIIGLCDGPEAVASLFKQAETQVFVHCAVCSLGRSGQCSHFASRKVTISSANMALSLQLSHSLDRHESSGLMIAAAEQRMIRDVRRLVGDQFPLLVSIRQLAKQLAREEAIPLITAGLDIYSEGLIIDLPPEAIWDSDFSSGAQRINWIDQVLQQKRAERAA